MMVKVTAKRCTPHARVHDGLRPIGIGLEAGVAKLAFCHEARARPPRPKLISAAASIASSASQYVPGNMQRHNGSTQRLVSATALTAQSAPGVGSGQEGVASYVPDVSAVSG